MGVYAMLLGKNSKNYDEKAGWKLFLANCFQLKAKDNNYKELNEYLVRDNINNMLIVSIILMVTSVIKCICRMNYICYTDIGLSIFLVSVVYIFMWYFIRIDVIESITIKKYVYISFWFMVSVIGLKYLYFELMEYNSIYNYVMIMFLLIGFYVNSIHNTITIIMLNTIVAGKMVYSVGDLSVDIRLNLSIIGMIAGISILLMIIKYHNYIKDKRARIALRNVGGVDNLTNLLNRRGFEEKLTKLWPLMRDARKTMMAIMIDIDNFKSYNDTYGHIAGDQCLKDVTECIYDVASRKTDLIVRYGGEEIVVVFSDINEKDCLELAHSIQERVNALNIKPGTQATHPYVTVSMGVADMFVGNNNTIYDLIGKADEQLYYSKDAGRNRITMRNISIEFKCNDSVPIMR